MSKTTAILFWVCALVGAEPSTAGALSASAAAVVPPAASALPLVRIYADPGRWRLYKPLRTADPAAGLGEGDAQALARPDRKAVDGFVTRYVERIERAWLPMAEPAPELQEWLKAHPAVRREFWLALDPYYDDPKAACAVLESLRQRDAKRLERYWQLAIAMAVVWDRPDAVTSSRWVGVWGVAASQYPAAMDLMTVWDWFTEPKRQRALVFPPDKLVWPVLVHLVDLDVSGAEAEWALAWAAKARKPVEDYYPAVPYDHDKLNRRPTRLGSQPYSLENLLAKGGVCGDQGHFATRVAKCQGIPAMKCCGQNRFGSLHAWAGFLVAKGNRPLLEFAGRYNFDFYYTGEVFDPQTRTEVLDRSVAMLYEGASGNYPRYITARALARAARAAMADDPSSAAQLARQAIQASAFVGEAWTTYFDLAVQGAIPRSEAAKSLDEMVKALAGHPDLTLVCVERYLQAVPRDLIDERQRLYESAYALYAQAKRPDLQIRLRIAQCEELAEAGRHQELLGKSLGTVVANAAEGIEILPLVEQVVAMARRFSTTKGFRMDVLRQELAKAEKVFPKQRINEVSDAWKEYQKLVAQLP